VSGVELYIQFLINNGLLIDDVKCFDLLSHLRTYMGSGLNDKKVHQFASTPEVDQILLKIKKWPVPLRIVEVFRGL